MGGRGRWGAMAIVLALSALAASSCATRKASPEYIFGVADILQMHVTASPGEMDRVSVVLSGSLRDGCTTINSVRQSLEGHTLIVTVTTKRPIDGTCDQRPVEFERTVPLVLRGLRPGEYTVEAGGLTASFRMEQAEVVIPL